MKAIFNFLRVQKIFKFLKNVIYLQQSEIRYELSDAKAKIYELQNSIESVRKEFLYFRIMDYFEAFPTEIYTDELNFLRETKSIQAFPYHPLKRLGDVITGFDSEKNMPYVLHLNTMKLYFPVGWTVASAKRTYCKYIEVENLLGGKYSDKCPHQYESENIKVEVGDVIIDIGSAEALFSLHHVKTAKKVIIIEENPVWIAPLQATFEPFQDKAILVHKRISVLDDAENITLKTCLSNIDYESVFIKLDIEGGETEIIANNEAFLSSSKNIKLACCTYHNHDDEEKLLKLFSAFGYQTECSDGYMLFHYDKNIKPPFFRRGIVRASRKS